MEPEAHEEVTIDVSSATTHAQLLEILRNALHFPDWTGKNWDALEDTINGIVEMPNRVVFTGCVQLNDALPRDSRIMHEVFDLWASRPIAGKHIFAVEYRD